MTIHIFAYGTPRPKGSAKAFVIKGTNRAVVTSDTKGLKGWESIVRQAAQDEMKGNLLVGPVRVVTHFYLPRPKRLTGKETPPHISRPDLDKLVRGVLDPLTGVVWSDDAQVTRLVAEKRYAGDGEQPRAVIAVELI